MRHVRIVSLSLLLCAVAGAQVYGECKCGTAKVENEWCSDCGVGYFAGVKLKSQDVLEALKGRTVEGGEIKCGACKTAYASDGVCTHCSVVFADKKVYHSSVAHRLAKGKAKDVEGIACPSCSRNAAGSGWCDTCKVGMVGNLAFKDKKEFEQAAEARKTLLAAAGSKCEKCAVARVTDGKCDACKVEYKHCKKLAKGKP